MFTYEERIAQHLRELGIGPSYATDRGLALCVEPPEVVLIGLDIFGRPRHLEPAAARQWSAMCEAAKADDIELLLVSAKRETWRFEADDNAQWRRVPDSADPILLVRQ